MRNGRLRWQCKGLVTVPCVFLRQGLRIFLVWGIFLSLGFSALSASAQSENSLQVQPPDTADFPLIQLTFKLPASSDPSIPLEVGQLRVFEEDWQVSVSDVSQERKGVHFTLAINGGYDLAVRDANGVSVYETLSAALMDWADTRRFDPGDSWSLVTHEGAAVRNQSTPGPWVNALAAYQPNFRTMTPDYSSVKAAFQLTRERVVPFGVDKVLLVLTLPPAPDQIEIVNRMAVEAQSADIRVNIWMVGDAYFLNNDQGQSLVNLASSSGGEFVHIDGSDPLPDPEAYLASLGVVYHISYLSAIRQTGDYRVQIEVDHGGETYSGESGLFHLSVLPPKPILVSPPLSITRQERPETTGSMSVYSHGQQEVKFLVEFPDGRMRDIAASRLYVNDRLADEISEPPFDSLMWDLSQITESGKFVVQVEIEDAFGLTARTNAVPVQVNVIQQEAAEGLTSRQIGWIMVVVLLLGAVVLLLVWAVRRWWQSSIFKEVRASLKTLFSAGEVEKTIQPESKLPVLAYLIPTGVIDEGWRAPAIPIRGTRVSIGQDPESGNLVINENALDGVQAQILIRHGKFTITDLGEEGCTWVNYVRVEKIPVQMKTGDLIHFGNAGFRFTIIEDQISEKPIIEPYEPLL